jgi:hypothetical protein
MAYKLYKELERQLKLKNANISTEQAIEIAKTIYSIQIINPINYNASKKILLLNDEQKYLAKLFDF